VQKNNRGRSFSASEEPTACRRAVAVSPRFFSNFQASASPANGGKSLGRDEIRAARWNYDSVDNRDQGNNQRYYQQQQDRQ
jgi:predicted RNase H-like nuclease